MAAENEFNDESYGITNTVTKNEIIEEAEDYYGLAVSWVYNNGNNSKTYSEKVLSFKKSTYDYESSFSHETGKNITKNKIITKDKNKIKTILDTIYKIENKSWASFKWINSKLDDNSDSYTYELEYQYTIEGDWGLEDEIVHERITLTVDKNTGEIGKPQTTTE